MKTRVVNALPQRFINDYRGLQREGTGASAHDVFCSLFKVYQPGALVEMDDIDRKISSPNICSDASATLRELRSWKAAIRRAGELNMRLPNGKILSRSAVGVNKSVFERPNTNVCLAKKWGELPQQPGRAAQHYSSRPR